MHTLTLALKTLFFSSEILSFFFMINFFFFWIEICSMILQCVCFHSNHNKYLLRFLFFLHILSCFAAAAAAVFYNVFLFILLIHVYFIFKVYHSSLFSIHKIQYGWWFIFHLALKIYVILILSQLNQMYFIYQIVCDSISSTSFIRFVQRFFFLKKIQSF